MVSDGEHVLLDAAAGGDEPVLLARRRPGLRVLCGPDRARLAADGGRDGGRRAPARRRLPAPAAPPRPRRGGPGRVEPLGQRPLPAVRPEPRAPLGAAPGRARLAVPRRPGVGRRSWRRCGSCPAASPGAIRWSRAMPRGIWPTAGWGRPSRSPALAGRRVGLLTGVARPESVRRTVEGLGGRGGGEVRLPRPSPVHGRARSRAAMDAVREPGRGVAGDDREGRGAGCRGRWRATHGSARCGSTRRCCGGRSTRCGAPAPRCQGERRDEAVPGRDGPAASGWLLWTLHVRRGVVMDNLRLAFPEWTEAERRDVGRADLRPPRPDGPRVPAGHQARPGRARADVRLRPGTCGRSRWRP